MIYKIHQSRMQKETAAQLVPQQDIPSQILEQLRTHNHKCLIC